MPGSAESISGRSGRTRLRRVVRSTGSTSGWYPCGASGCSVPRSSASKRSRGTALSVRCTRTFATSSSHRRRCSSLNRPGDRPSPGNYGGRFSAQSPINAYCTAGRREVSPECAILAGDSVQFEPGANSDASRTLAAAIAGRAWRSQSGKARRRARSLAAARPSTSRIGLAAAPARGRTSLPPWSNQPQR